MIKIVLKAVLEDFKPRADKSYKIVLGTAQELKPEDVKHLASLFQKEGVLYFSESAMEDKDIQEVEVIAAEKESFRKPKSLSKRLRDVIFVYHDQQGYVMNFDDYYKEQMERFIQRYKDLLD